MTGPRFGQGINVFPLLPPKDIANATTDTAYIDLYDANWLTFYVELGNMTSDASDTVTFSVAVSTDASTTNVCVAFNYRLSSAMTAAGTNVWGDITAGSSDGTAIAGATDDNKAILIDVDPAVVGAAVAGARYCRLDIAATGPITLLAASAFVESRYPANTMTST